jgi:hypothetical protein
MLLIFYLDVAMTTLQRSTAFVSQRLLSAISLRLSKTLVSYPPSSLNDLRQLSLFVVSDFHQSMASSSSISGLHQLLAFVSQLLAFRQLVIGPRQSVTFASQ